MARGINRLTDLEVKSWIKNPARTPKKLFDGDGLFLTMTPSGTAVWRLRYRLGARDAVFSIGKHSDVSLKQAREERDAARALLRQGKDPVVMRQVDRAKILAQQGNTLAEIGEAWLAQKKGGWSEAHYMTTSETFERHVTKYIGRLPIQECSHALIATVVERLGERVDTAQKVRQILAGVFRYAQAKGKFVGENPADAAREVIGRRKLKGRRAAFTTWPELGDLLRRAESANLTSAVRMAHRLCAFTAARIGNVISAQWTEFDLNAEPPLWVIPRAKMKSQDRHFDHKVILGKQIADELRAWSAATEGEGYLFPAVAGGQEFISSESVSKAYRVTLKLADKHSPHGWRSAFSTLARDNGFDREAVELALDHVHDNDVARAYDRGERLDLRVELATWWNEQLMKAQRGEL